MNTKVTRCYKCHRPKAYRVLNPQIASSTSSRRPHPMGQGTSAPSAVAGGNPRGNGHPVPLPPRCDGPLGDPTVVGVAGFPNKKCWKWRKMWENSRIILEVKELSLPRSLVIGYVHLRHWNSRSITLIHGKLVDAHRQFIDHTVRGWPNKLWVETQWYGFGKVDGWRVANLHRMWYINGDAQTRVYLTPISHLSHAYLTPIS
jgi:hypothetical protein